MISCFPNPARDVTRLFSLFPRDVLSDQQSTAMGSAKYLSLLLVVCCVALYVSAAPSLYRVARADDSYNVLSGRPCIQQCQAKCGGICYLNMMAFNYICSCTRMGK